MFSVSRLTKFPTHASSAVSNMKVSSKAVLTTVFWWWMTTRTSFDLCIQEDSKDVVEDQGEEQELELDPWKKSKLD